MTNDGANEEPSHKAETRADKRAGARQKARDLREVQKKKDRRNRHLLQGGIVLGSLLIVGVVALVIWSQIPTVRTGPVNMLSDGIKIGEALEVVTTPGLQPGAEPVPSDVVEGSDVIDIRVYLDYQCPGCRDFEETNHEQLSTWVESGAATVEFHPIAILDRYSLGQKYSTRAANAAACVDNYSPNAFFDFNSLMFANQPEEGSEGLSDEEMVALAKRSKAGSSDLISKCIDGQNYKSWVNGATARAIAGPIPGSSVERVASTPTVIVNGVEYDGSLTDAESFATFASTAAGNAFTQKSATETPAPAP